MLAYLKFEQYIVFCITYIYPLMHIFGHKKLKVSVFKVLLPKEFSKVAMTNACKGKFHRVTIFFMKPKFLDVDKIYNLHFNEKIVTPKHLPLQGFVVATL